MNEWSWMAITDYRNNSCNWFSLTCHYIDKIVVEAAAKYLRSVCGDTLDSHTGPNYEVSINQPYWIYSVSDRVLQTCSKKQLAN